MIELRFKTYTLPIQVETRFKQRFDQLRTRAEAQNIDLWRMFNQGIPGILDDIEQAMNTLPEQQEGPTPQLKKRGNRWTKPQIATSTLADLVPPNGSTDGAEADSETND